MKFKSFKKFKRFKRFNKEKSLVDSLPFLQHLQ